MMLVMKALSAGYERMLEAVSGGQNSGDGELVQPGSIANKVAAEFGTTGLPISVCTACASGATAIGLGVEAIRRGEQDGSLHWNGCDSTSRSHGALYAAVCCFHSQ